jgi:hypothetical protein
MKGSTAFWRGLERTDFPAANRWEWWRKNNWEKENGPVPKVTNSKEIHNELDILQS